MTTTLTLPSEGLSISEFPIDLARKKHKLQQAIEIRPDNASLEEIISSISSGVEVTVSLGKKPVILLDKQVIPIKTIYQPQSLLFRHTKDATSLQLKASLNLKDALARAKLAKSRDINMNDPAIVALQASMAQVKEQKDANQAVVVNASSLGPSKSGRSALSSLQNHRKGLFGGSGASHHSPIPSRSPAASPAMGGITPQPIKMDRESLKQKAIKKAFIHLLATRAYSQGYMLNVLHITTADLEPLLEKYGKKTLEKYNLSDRGYKELDPWEFAYKEDDRTAAIDRAVIAFDRMRISVGDPLWQRLLKKEERGTGKVLSKLANLHTGPVERIKTPKIQVETSTEDASNNNNNNNNERGRLALPSDTNASNVKAGSKSPQNSTRKKPATASSKLGSVTTTSEKADNEMPAATKATLSEHSGKKPMVVKKPVPKKPAPTRNKTPVSSGKVKSAEIIEDSDEEIKSDEIATQSFSKLTNKRKADHDISPISKKMDIKKTAPAKPTIPQPPIEKVVSKTKSKPSTTAIVKKPQQDITTKKPSTTPSSQSQNNKPKSSDAQRSVPMARNLSGKKGTSPVKPSPLGSSPPTNASDFENDKNHKAGSTKSSSSSSSGSPLINQRRERLFFESQQRKAAVPSPSINSDKNLKRKANDLENGNHSNGGFSTRDTSTPASEQPSKRPRTSSSTSASDSDQRSNTSSNTSPSVVLSPQDLRYAQEFKKQWQRYTDMLRELQALSDPPPEKVEKLQKLYEKLTEHKATIYSWEKRQTA